MTYPIPHFQLLLFPFKDTLLTTTALLPLEGSVKVAKSTRRFISLSLFWGHRSCRQPGFKLRLSMGTELGVLVVTFCRGQRSHLGHLSMLWLFFHWGQIHEGFSSSQGLCALPKAVLACSQALGLSPRLQARYPVRNVVTPGCLLNPLDDKTSERLCKVPLISRLI